MLGVVSTKFSVPRAQMGLSGVSSAVLGLAWRQCGQSGLTMTDSLSLTVTFWEVMVVWLRTETKPRLSDRLVIRRWRWTVLTWAHNSAGRS